MTPTQYGEVYTVTEVAAIFRVPSDTVRRLINRGDLPAIRLGRVYRVPKAVIDGLFDLPEEFGFGVWGKDPNMGDAVTYVDHLRDADPRTLREVVADLNS
jgi:excisionase family DNA binding protein